MPKKPKHTFQPTGRPMKAPFPDKLWEPHLVPEKFDEYIAQFGLRWTHEKAALCPNVDDIDAKNHDPNCHGCDRGYQFFGKKEILGSFQQNKLEKMYETTGVWDIGQAVCTFQSHADGPNGPGTGEPNDFQIGDKLTCLDYTFTWGELKEASGKGIDRLRYPAVTVEYLADKNKQYHEHVHFEITPEGHIKWLTNDRPKYQQHRGRGGIYTIVYTAQPVFFVMQVMHEMRATKGWDLQQQKIKPIRLPQQVLIRRDFLFQHPDDQSGDPDIPAPRSTTITPG